MPMPANTLQSKLFIGIMSGTSADAIDVVIVDCTEVQQVQLLGTYSHAWPAEIRERILQLGVGCAHELDLAGYLDREIAVYFAQAVNNALAQAGLSSRAIRAIGSHGQTVRHRPNGPWPFSMQLGDPNTIAELTGISVVADFRRRDIAAGGQGAPLVPAFHQHYFTANEDNIVVLNLGGIANMTVLQPGLSVTGYDIGPANMLMDGWCQRHLNQRFDRDGEWAASGTVHQALLAQLLTHPYFQQKAPKSTGREDFGMAWLEHELTRLSDADTLGSHALRSQDVQATLAAFSVEGIRREVASIQPGGQLLVCGGGALNTEIMRLLQRALPDWQVASTAAHGLDPLWVEACAFAWLAERTVRGLSSNVPSVTGARGARVLGGYYPAHAGLELP